MQVTVNILKPFPTNTVVDLNKPDVVPKVWADDGWHHIAERDLTVKIPKDASRADIYELLRQAEREAIANVSPEHVLTSAAVQTAELRITTRGTWRLLALPSDEGQLATLAVSIALLQPAKCQTEVGSLA